MAAGARAGRRCALRDTIGRRCRSVLESVVDGLVERSADGFGAARARDEAPAAVRDDGGGVEQGISAARLDADAAQGAVDPAMAMHNDAALPVAPARLGRIG